MMTQHEKFISEMDKNDELLTTVYHTNRRLPSDGVDEDDPSWQM